MSRIQFNGIVSLCIFTEELLHVTSQADNAGIIARAILDGGLQQVQVDSSRTVADSAFFNPSYIGSLDTAYANRLLNATKEQCIKLKFMANKVIKQANHKGKASSIEKNMEAFLPVLNGGEYRELPIVKIDVSPFNYRKTW